MRSISSLLAVSVCTTGLIVACGGGLGSPTDSLLGNDPIPNSSDHVGSSTDPPGSSTDPTGDCPCPVGTWDCGGQIDSTVKVSLANGVCTAGEGIVIDCAGHFSFQGISGSVKAQGNDLYACVGGSCATCSPKTTVVDDGGGLPDTGLPDTSLPDTGVKDTGIVDTGTDAGGDAAACASLFCSFNSDCAGICPAAPNGLVNCCDQNTNSCTLDVSCSGP